MQYPKLVSVREVQVKSLTHYFGSFLTQKIKERHVLMHSTTFNNRFKRIYRSNLRQLCTSFDTKKSNLMYPSIMDNAE